MERFGAVFVQDGDWWVGVVEELPGANSQGKTLEEARDNLKDALQMVLQVNRALAREEMAGKDVVREELILPTA